MDIIGLTAIFLRDHRFKVERREPNKFYSYPWLIVKQSKRRGWVRILEFSQGIKIIYSRNGHERAITTVELADPESLPQLLQFMRTTFRTYGK